MRLATTWSSAVQKQVHSSCSKIGGSSPGLQKRSGDDGSTDGGSGLATQGCPVTYYRLFGQGGIVIVPMIGCLGGGGGGGLLYLSVLGEE